MGLENSYTKIRKSIVAIGQKYEKRLKDSPPPKVPPVLGTGFIIDDGIIVTNDHIVKEIDNLFKPADAPKDEWPIVCFLFTELNNSNHAMVPLEVIGKFQIGNFAPIGSWYGEKISFLKMHILFVRSN